MSIVATTQPENEYITVSQERTDALNHAACEALAFDSSQALELSNEAYQLASKTSYQYGLACALLNMGKATQRLARFESSVKHLVDANKNFEDLKDIHGQMESLLYLGHSYKDLGQLNDASKAYEQALEINQNTDYLRERAGILNGIASIYRIKAEYENSIYYLEQSLNVNRQLEDKLGEANCLNNTGILLTRIAKYPEALESLLNSYKLIRNHVKDGRFEANCLINIGVVYEELRDNHNALKYYLKALEVGQAAGDPLVATIATVNVGLMRHALGEQGAALELFRDALVISHRIGFRQGEIAALGGLGRVQGELGHYDSARNAHESSLVIAREIGDREQEIESLLNIGRLRLAAHEPKLALEPLKEALVLALEAERKQSLCDCHEALSTAFERLGDPMNALEHYRAFHRAEREVRSEEADKKTRNLTAQLELGQAKAEAEILRLRNEVAEQGREVAERANQAKSEFLSRMSHELRTPLNAILGFTQLLSLSNFEPKHQRSIERIHRAGEYLLRLVDEVLDISRIEAGRLTMMLEPVSVRAAVEDALELVRPLAVKRRVQLQGLERGDWQALTDRHRLDQVLLNLLSNAIKYNRDGGRVEVTCEGIAPDRVRVSVRDTGAGMSEAQIQRLFMPFERLGAEGGSIEGFGLGLTITKRIVEALGGRVGVSSTVGEGSAFWVDLPCFEMPTDEATAEMGPEIRSDLAPEREPASLMDGPPVPPRPAKPGAEADTDPAAPAVVLCLGLDVTSQRLIQLVLAGRPDTTVFSAPEGSSAVMGQHPDLIFLGGEDGATRCLETLRELKSSPQIGAVSVVVLVPEADIPAAERLLEAGASSFIPKPFDVQAILGAVHQAVRLKVSNDGPPEGHAWNGRSPHS